MGRAAEGGWGQGVIARLTGYPGKRRVVADATEVGRREERMELPTTNSTGTTPDARPGDSRRIGRAFGRAGVAGDPRGVPKAGFRVLSAGADASNGKDMETEFFCGAVKPSR